MTGNPTPARIIAVWADHDPDPGVHVFTPDDYADWAEINHLTGTYPYPSHFYTAITGGVLAELHHHIDISTYDDDYATVTHLWACTGTPTVVYATGCTRRDGRA
jgi:hypothetical protein